MQLSQGPPMKELMERVQKKRSATFNPLFSSRASQVSRPNTVSRGNQTDADAEGIDYKNSYNELTVVHQELMKKYEDLKAKNEEIKGSNEELKYRMTHLPITYRNAYYNTSTENLALSKQLNHMKYTLQCLLDKED